LTERTSEKALPCIVCKGELPNIDPTGNQPSGGLEFTTHGHYGSTIFDPMGGGVFLCVNICDGCVSDAAKDGAVLFGEMPPPAPRNRILRPWDGEEDGTA